MKARVDSEEQYLETEAYWKDDFEVEWHEGTQRYNVKNKHTGQFVITRCLVKAFKICYLAQQWLNRQKLDEATADLLEQVADLLDITIVQLNKRMLALN